MEPNITWLCMLIKDSNLPEMYVDPTKHHLWLIERELDMPNMFSFDQVLLLKNGKYRIGTPERWLDAELTGWEWVLVIPKPEVDDAN